MFARGRVTLSFLLVPIAIEVGSESQLTAYPIGSADVDGIPAVIG